MLDKAIWAIHYDLAEPDRAGYLAWFHETHMPEKLARPGYLWAAHYEIVHGGSGSGFLALFGAEAARAFLNPSPGQLARLSHVAWRQSAQLSRGQLSRGQLSRGQPGQRRQPRARGLADRGFVEPGSSERSGRQ